MEKCAETLVHFHTFDAQVFQSDKIASKPLKTAENTLIVYRECAN